MKMGRGFSILEVVVALGLITLSLVFITRSVSRRANPFRDLRERAVAQGYVTELLEVFRAHSSLELRKYYKENPSNPALAPYPFCAHVNFLDRTNDKIINADPLADIANPQIGDASAARRVNRYYQINVINMDTLQVKQSAHCNLNALGPPIASTERYLVTVGVTWVPHGRPDNTLERVVQSTILPD